MATPFPSDDSISEAHVQEEKGTGVPTRRGHLYPNELHPCKKLDIVVSGRPDEDILRDYLGAIKERNESTMPWVFSRGESLVYLRRDADLRAWFDEVDLDAMLYIAEHSATTYALRRDEEKSRKLTKTFAPVPRRIAAMLLKSTNLSKHFPVCHTITQSPGLRVDGTLYRDPGFDVASGVYYDPPQGFELPPIPDEPTQDDARAAVATLEDVLTDFPFTTPADKANALALALTLVTRHAIDGLVPMACISATSDKGTGKTFLAEILHLIATGESPATQSLPEDDVEMRKVVTSQIAAGQSVVFFDNVRGTVNLKSLEAALTSQQWNERLLGTNKTLKGKNRATWIATGNQMQLGGDLQRRCYFVHLDAKMPRAYLRNNYKYPFLRQHVLEHRGELLAALLTIARAWFAADKPDAPLTLFAGSYPEWSRMMAGMLAYAGVEGFLTTLERDLDEQSEEEQQWEAFLLRAHELLGDRLIQAKDIALACLPAISPELGSLMDAMPDSLVGVQDKCRTEHAFQIQVSKFLRNRGGRRFGKSGVHIVAGGIDTRGGRTLWQIIVPAADAPPAPLALVETPKIPTQAQLVEDLLEPPPAVQPVMAYHAAAAPESVHMEPIAAIASTPEPTPAQMVAPTTLSAHGIVCPNPTCHFVHAGVDSPVTVIHPLRGAEFCCRGCQCAFTIDSYGYPKMTGPAKKRPSEQPGEDDDTVYR